MGDGDRSIQPAGDGFEDQVIDGLGCQSCGRDQRATQDQEQETQACAGLHVSSIVLNLRQHCKVGALPNDTGRVPSIPGGNNKEVLMTDILIPNESIEAGYEEYLVETTDGRLISSVIALETPPASPSGVRRASRTFLPRRSVAARRLLSLRRCPTTQRTTSACRSWLSYWHTSRACEAGTPPPWYP